MFSYSFPTPELEGHSNLTTLDMQLKKLRDSALTTIKDGVRRMREEATEIRDTLSDIEAWVEKLQQLAEEVQTDSLNLNADFYHLQMTSEPLNVHQNLLNNAKN